MVTPYERSLHAWYALGAPGLALKTLGILLVVAGAFLAWECDIPSFRRPALVRWYGRVLSLLFVLSLPTCVLLLMYALFSHGMGRPVRLSTP